jgi:hypothetical protein
MTGMKGKLIHFYLGQINCVIYESGTDCLKTLEMFISNNGDLLLSPIENADKHARVVLKSELFDANITIDVDKILVNKVDIGCREFHVVPSDILSKQQLPTRIQNSLIEIHVGNN